MQHARLLTNTTRYWNYVDADAFYGLDVMYHCDEKLREFIGAIAQN
jgi:hypothetical protein